MVYRYSIPQPPTTQRCREYLFTPATGGFQLGMTTGCCRSLANFTHPPRASSGRLGKSTGKKSSQ